MKKILLVMEDYNELVFIETVLKKIGFDCMGLLNDNGISDKILSFSPALIVADGAGRKIKGLELSQKIKRGKNAPKLILVLTPPQTISDEHLLQFNISGVFHRPIHPIQFVKEIARILDLDLKTIEAKIDKLGLFQSHEKEKFKLVKDRERKHSSGSALFDLRDSDQDAERRNKKYQKFLDNLPEPTVNGIPRNKVSDQVRDFRAREDDPEIREIDQERLAFVKALFKKA